MTGEKKSGYKYFRGRSAPSTDRGNASCDRSHSELAMIKNSTTGDNKVPLTLLLPFPNVPIRDHLVNSVREAVMKLGVEVKIKIEHMNQEELRSFLTMEQGSWNGFI
jgi:hypothetical protein